MQPHCSSISNGRNLFDAALFRRSISNGGAGLEPGGNKSGHQQAENLLGTALFSISNGGAGLEQKETVRQVGHQQAETSSMQPCSEPFSNGGAGLEPRAEDKWFSSRQKPLRCSPVPVFLMVELDWSKLRQVDTSRQKPL
ncbi:hypothetical protein TNIN_440431 [Trichonephila inaurata madagascariensis]|uniref:Uncharacterized protein n=1 Tax=Trichonephila inaurata madagascariensis TaxID=2747483 RepID=A0A8X7CQD4_9ARAC|nr:hypothetical protein TNIN_440431 [Trichonephila inaurata madagascariensis]